jgi:hypothetical protein
MTIFRKKRGITSKNKSSLQNGGAVKIPGAESAGMAKIGSAGPGRFGRFAKSASHKGRQALSGVKKFGSSAVNYSRKFAEGVAQAPKVIAKGLVTGAVSVPLGIASASLAGVGQLGKATVKSLVKTPWLGIQKVREISARRALTKKLGGLDMPTFTRKLDKYNAIQKQLTESHKQQTDNINKKYAILLGNATKTGNQIEVDKVAAQKNKETTALIAAQNKQDQNLSKKTTKIGSKISKIIVGPTDNSSIKNISSVRNLLAQTYAQKKAGFEVELVKKKEKRGIDEKQSKINLDRVGLTGKKTQIDLELASKKSALENAEKAIREHIPNTSSVLQDPKFYAEQTKLYAIEKAAKQDFAKQLKTHKEESLGLDKYEKNILKREKELVKLTPRELSNFEGKYYNRKQAYNKNKQNWGSDFRAIPQAMVKGLSFGLKQGNRFGAYNINNTKKALLLTKPKQSVLSTQPTKSEYTFGETFLKSGLNPFTSTQKQAENYDDLLYGKVKTGSQGEGVPERLKSTLIDLDQAIAANKDQIEKYKSDPTKYKNILELQSEIKQFSDDKIARQKIIIAARQKIVNFTNEKEFGKNKMISNANKPALDSILSSSTTTNIDKNRALVDLASNVAQSIKDNPNDMNLLEDYKKIKGLVKYYQGQILKTQITNELTAYENSKPKSVNSVI